MAQALAAASAPSFCDGFKVPPSDPMICDGTVATRTESLGPLSLLGGGVMSRVTLPISAAGPSQAARVVGADDKDHLAALAAPDRLLLRCSGGKSEISRFFASLLGSSDVTINRLGADLWSVIVPYRGALPDQAPATTEERKAFPDAPGLALVSMLQRGRSKDPLLGPISATIDRVIQGPAPDRGAESAHREVQPPSSKMGARILAAPTQYDIWLVNQGVGPDLATLNVTAWSSPAAVAIVDSGIADFPAQLTNIRRDLGADTSGIQAPAKTTPSCSVACDRDMGHGTKVAGTVASKSYGVALNTPLIPINIYDSHQCTTYSAIIAGICAAAKVNASIVVLPWNFAAPTQSPLQCGSGTQDDDPICAAIESQTTMLFIAAAGDTPGPVGDTYPASWAGAIPNLLTVGGVDEADNWSNSAFDAQRIRLAGFSGQCYVLTKTENTEPGGGTSLAAGFVAGAAALYWSATSSPTAPTAITALATSARRIGAFTTCCANCGVLDVRHALGGKATTGLKGINPSPAPCKP